MTSPCERELLGEVVVLDTATPLAYIGRLEDADETVVDLHEVDVFDGTATRDPKALYLMEAARDGYVPNRERVWVYRSLIVSCSRLDEIKVFS